MKPIEHVKINEHPKYFAMGCTRWKKKAIITIDGKHRLEVEWECEHEDCGAGESHALGEAVDMLYSLVPRLVDYRTNKDDAIDVRIEEVWG